MRNYSIYTTVNTIQEDTASSLIVTTRSRLELRRNFFSERVVSHKSYWNKLPTHVIEAGTVNSFKNRLDKFNGAFKVQRTCQPVKYMYKYFLPSFRITCHYQTENFINACKYASTNMEGYQKSYIECSSSWSPPIIII